ncbi:uncharacterized protein, partial [Hetaerina americana]|uniref:uncharacterized protein n=1 Tax=Hetaerina americana TaxID=62018 RepID=UPI003A7F1F80
PESVELIRNASIAYQAKLYLDLSVKFRKAELNILFNRKCLALDVIPKYVNLRTTSSTRSAQHAVESAQKIWIRRELKNWYSKRDAYSVYLYQLHSELSFNLHPAEWNSLHERFKTLVSEVSSMKCSIINRKLHALTRERDTTKSAPPPEYNCDPKFHPKVLNLSNSNFDSSEMDLLQKGLKFAPNHPLTQRTLKSLIVDCEVSLRKEKVGLKQICADIITSRITDLDTVQPKKVTLQKKVLRSIQSKIEDEDLIISKADKGNSVVILNKSLYVDKCIDVLTNNPFVLIPRDPTARFHNSVKSALSACKTLFKDSEIRYLLQMNPQPPRFYGLPKVHKDGTPIRPVVSCIGSPSYKLATKMNTVFRQVSSFSTKHGVKNSISLAQNLLQK